MFVAFWFSFLTFILLIIPFCSLSFQESTVIGTNWNRGHVKLPIDSDLTYYIGLRMVTVRCDGISCPDISSFTWEEDVCRGNYCANCKDSVSGTVTSAVLSLITMLPQMGTNLQRSKKEGDMNCQKWMAIFTGVIGIFSNLGTISNYMAGCFNDFPNSYEYLGATYNITYSLGPSVWCLIWATIFKALDLIFNLLLPVPASGYWGEEADGGKENVLEEAHLQDGTSKNPMIDEAKV
jgi:hypothetical protein